MQRQIQIGPVYHCWTCGAPASGLLGWREAMCGAPTFLDDWADHIAYLRLPKSCDQAGHPHRVARLGAAITPLRWDEDGPVEARVAAIRQALDDLVRQVGPRGAPEDPAASIVYRLLAGVLAPEVAIREIRALMAPIPTLAVPIQEVTR